MPMLSTLRRCLTIANGSVLAYPWWHRLLLVLPVCVLLWAGVAWALWGDVP